MDNKKGSKQNATTQINLEYIAKNIYAGANIGGLKTKNLVKEGEKLLLKKYNK